MLKPNTRFLRHIIKDTDNHNKALLAKEAAESRARLKDLERTEDIKRRRTNPTIRDIRKRQMGDIHAILGGKKRRKSEDDKEGQSSKRDSTSRDLKIRGASERESSEKSETDRDLIKSRRDDHRHHGRLDRDDRHRRSGERSRKDSRRRSRSRSRGDSADGSRRRHRSRRDRSKSPGRRRRSRSPRERRSKHRHRSPLEEPKKSPRREEKEEEDSDPLEDLIGPAPPPRYRGRGTVGGSSGIDRRFSETYDPKADVHMNDDDAGSSDWDDAVEAFRDRQKLRQNQEQRLRAAGFTEDQFQRLNGSKGQMEADVKWSKAGEKREWDRGKVEGTDEVVSGDEL